MIDIREVADNLVPGEGGIWFAKDRLEISYPEAGNEFCYGLEEGSFWFRHRNACIVQVMAHYPPAGTIFDVGGGNGFVAMALNEAGFESILVEPAIQGVRNAAARGLSPLVCSTLEGAGFRPGALPAIGLFDVIEHIQDDLAFLKSIRGILAPGGRVYITTPAYGWLWSASDEDAGHFRRYTVRSLGAVLRTAGFAPEFASYFFASLTLPALLFRALPSRLGLRRGGDLADYRQELKPSAGWLNQVLELSLRPELSSLGRRMPIPFGGSCLAVARRL
jgi:SAM-dependent methyltransferase